MKIRSILLSHVLLSALLFSSAGWAGNNTSSLNLPDLGDTTAGIVSRQQEYEVGRAWLRLYRSRVPDYNDPETEIYLEQLLTRIAAHSSLPNKSFQLVLVSNPTLNAFAAPGGVVGVHSGLFLTAETEAELASVLSHELAHLSQRHWVRNVEASRENTLPTLAGLLAGLVLLATSNGEAGMAAITSTQAASLQSALRFSRQNEQEADNIGMRTLAEAGFDPNAMTDMFEHMLEANRFQGRRPPEYLLSHPVTEKRIADSRARAMQMPVPVRTDNFDYQLVRVRAQLHHSENAQVAVKRFRSETEGNSRYPEASRYGLALALTDDHQYAEADKRLRELIQQRPQENAYRLALGRLELQRGNPAACLAALDPVLQQAPRDIPARLLAGKALVQQQRYGEAEQVYQQLARERPEDVHVWYELAEISGLAKNILGVHLARAEYFVLNGVYDKARVQLGYAQELAKNNYIETERIKQKLLDIDVLENISLEI